MMINNDTELLFPLRVIPALQNMRGVEWQQLIERVLSPEAEEIEQIAFTAIAAKLCGCSACNADSFRAMKGCTQCARLTIKRNRLPDQDLVELYQSALEDVRVFIQKRENAA